MVRRNRYTGPPMTLGNMRENHVRLVTAYCGARNCWHQAKMSLDHMPDDTVLLALDRRMRGTKCGHLGAEVQPNWHEAFSSVQAPASSWVTMPPRTI